MANRPSATETDADLTFWQRLVKASKFADIPCRPIDIAEELGVSPGAVTKYVRDGSIPQTDRVNALAQRRKVRSEWLLSGRGEMVSEEDLDPKALEMLQGFLQLDDAARERQLANLRYELAVAESQQTGKREALTEELIRLLESKRQRRHS